VDFRRIAIKISGYKVSSDPEIESLISKNIKSQYGISSGQKAFESGVHAAVYPNNRGNIVAFIPSWIGREDACQVAYDSVGRNLTTVPEVFDLDKIKISPDKDLCVIEMEKLSPLSDDEQEEIWALLIKNKHLLEFSDIKNFLNEKEEISPLMHDLLNLIDRMEKENISHTDFSHDNVGRGQDGKLKLLDWESIYFL
jgi:hypothetical protein